MTNRVSTNPEVVSQGRLAVERSGARPRAAEAYNRSSLAVDFDESWVEDLQPLPHLVPIPAIGSVAVVRGAPSFMSLDVATRQRDPAAKVVSFIVHTVVIAGILWLGVQAHQAVVAPVAVPVNITLYAPPPPPKILPVAPKMGGGGGGGAHEIIEPTRGNPPRIVAPAPVNAPQVLRIQDPKLAAEPSEIVKMPENPALSNLGLSNSPQIALASQGKGSNSGFGSGMGGGLGMGHGIGAGPGSGGGYGGGVMSVGGGVSAPEVVHSVQPEFTEDARQANFQGSASIELIVDQQGNPQNIRIVRHLGMGLDQKAVEAVRQYKFRPALYQGHPVAVQIVIDVSFHLH